MHISKTIKYRSVKEVTSILINISYQFSFLVYIYTYPSNIQPFRQRSNAFVFSSQYLPSMSAGTTPTSLSSMAVRPDSSLTSNTVHTFSPPNPVTRHQHFYKSPSRIRFFILNLK